jgi:hypothetical protein
VTVRRFLHTELHPTPHSSTNTSHYKRAIALSAFAFAGMVSARARAQASPDDARAQTLFDVAKRLRESGELADACPMFAESKRLAPGVGVTLYLADCYERTGRTASAWNEFQEGETLARERSDYKRADVARARARSLEPKLDRLTVAAYAGSHGEWQVLVDGIPLSSQRWNTPLPVDPGDHVVTINVPGSTTRTLRAHLGPTSAAATVIIDSPGETPPWATPASSRAVQPIPESNVPDHGAAESGGSSARLWIGLGVLGVGLGGIPLGTKFLFQREQLINRGGVCDTSANEQEAATAATVAFSIAGAALVSALVLYLTAPGSQNHVAIVAGPAAVLGGTGTAFRTTF